MATTHTTQVYDEVQDYKYVVDIDEKVTLVDNQDDKFAGNVEVLTLSRTRIEFDNEHQ